MIASAALWPAIDDPSPDMDTDGGSAAAPGAPTSTTTVSMPAFTTSIGRSSPIKPVEHTRTSPAPMSRPPACSAAAVRSAMVWLSAKPSGPVHAFAPPEFTITARALPSAMT